MHVKSWVSVKSKIIFLKSVHYYVGSRLKVLLMDRGNNRAPFLMPFFFLETNFIMTQHLISRPHLYLQEILPFEVQGGVAKLHRSQGHSTERIPRFCASHMYGIYPL